MNSKPRRAQGGLGLLSRSISVQHPQESRAQNLERRGRESREGETEGARAQQLCSGAGKEREGEGVDI